MFDKEITEETKVLLTDSLSENTARGGGDVHGASARSEVTINAEVVIVAEGISQIIESMKTAKQYKDGDVTAEEIRGKAGGGD